VYQVSLWNSEFFSDGSKFQFANTMKSSTVVVVFVIAAYGLATAYQCANSVLTDEDRDFILNIHNSGRSNVAKGLELNGPPSNPDAVPGAKNMYKMVNDLLLYSKIGNFEKLIFLKIEILKITYLKIALLKCKKVLIEKN
jgi:hypothetical protein